MFYSEKYDCFIDNDGCIYCYPDPKASRQPKEKLFYRSKKLKKLAKALFA